MNHYKSFWKQFLNTTVVPTIYVADSEIQPRRGVVFLKILKRLSEKDNPWLKKFVSKNDNMIEKYSLQCAIMDISLREALGAQAAAVAHATRRDPAIIARPGQV